MMKKLMKKVLIVDDNPHFIEALRFVIDMACGERLAFIKEVHNGEECLSFLENNMVDIIFMDIDMPRLNGIETTKIIVDKYRDIKIIAVTFHSAEEYIIEIIEAGARGFISKNKINKKQISEIIGCSC